MISAIALVLMAAIFIGALVEEMIRGRSTIIDNEEV